MRTLPVSALEVGVRFGGWRAFDVFVRREFRVRWVGTKAAIVIRPQDPEAVGSDLHLKVETHR